MCGRMLLLESCLKLVFLVFSSKKKIFNKCATVELLWRFSYKVICCSSNLMIQFLIKQFLKCSWLNQITGFIKKQGHRNTSQRQQSTVHIFRDMSLTTVHLQLCPRLVFDKTRSHTSHSVSYFPSSSVCLWLLWRTDKNRLDHKLKRGSKNVMESIKCSLMNMWFYEQGTCTKTSPIEVPSVIVAYHLTLWTERSHSLSEC